MYHLSLTKSEISDLLETIKYVRGSRKQILAISTKEVKNINIYLGRGWYTSLSQAHINFLWT